LDASSFDPNNGGRVSVGVTMNDAPMKLVVFDNRATQHQCIPLTGLRTGRNTLSLRRLEGGDWLAWDALTLTRGNAADKRGFEIVVSGDVPY